jgi:hypothetical protein
VPNALFVDLRTSLQMFSRVRHVVEDEFGDDDKLATRMRFCATRRGSTGTC